MRKLLLILLCLPLMTLAQQNCGLSYIASSSPTSTPTACDGWASISFVQTPFPPITYLWSTGSTQSYIINLCSGVYTVSITDDLGCNIMDTVIIGILSIPGCTDSTAFNYDSLASIDDGSCIAVVYGCTDFLALNYNALANVDDSTCIYTPSGMTYVPDSNFEAYLEANGMGNNISNDSNVFTSAIDTVTQLQVVNLSISDLRGIEDFIGYTLPYK